MLKKTRLMFSRAVVKMLRTFQRMFELPEQIIIDDHLFLNTNNAKLCN